MQPVLTAPHYQPPMKHADFLGALTPPSSCQAAPPGTIKQENPPMQPEALLIGSGASQCILPGSLQNLDAAAGAGAAEDHLNSVDAQLMMFDLLTNQAQQQPQQQQQQQPAYQQQASFQQPGWQAPTMPGSSSPEVIEEMPSQVFWALQQQFHQPHQQFLPTPMPQEQQQQLIYLYQQQQAQAAAERQRQQQQLQVKLEQQQQQAAAAAAAQAQQLQQQQQQVLWAPQQQPFSTTPQQPPQQQQQQPFSGGRNLCEQLPAPAAAASSRGGARGGRSNAAAAGAAPGTSPKGAGAGRGGSAAASAGAGGAAAAAGGAAAGAAAGGDKDEDFFEEEADMEGMTVMQRYHRRRKLNMQRMEREVEMKLAHVSLLEQENKHLKWQAHILENMLADIDKQLEVICASEEVDAEQWLTLLGMGSRKGPGGCRRLHLMLEGAAKTDVEGWTLEDCISRWRAFVEELRPLLAEVEEIRAAYLAQQQQGQVAAAAAGAGGRGKGQAGGRARRAAAKAATATMAEASAMLSDEGKEGPARGSAAAGEGNHTPACSAAAAAPVVAADAPMGEAAAAAAAAPTCRASDTGGSEDSSSHSGGGGGVGHTHSSASSTPVGEVDGQVVWGGSGTEGIPLPLLARIEGLVMRNFYWLLAILSKAPLLTFQFIGSDMEGQGRRVPGPGDEFWSRLVQKLPMSVDQMQEASVCLKLAERCMHKVYADREEVSRSLGQVRPGEDGPVRQEVTLAHHMNRMDDQLLAVERMEKSMRREAVVRNMVGFYNINVFSQLDLARISVYSYPYFCGAWSIVAALDQRLGLERQAAMALVTGSTGPCTRVTRSRARSQAGGAS